MIEAMKQALKALDRCGSENYSLEREAIESLRQAIEQAEKQEPVAWRYLTRYPSQNVWTYCGSEPETKPEREPLYTTPPQRKPLPPQSPCEMTQAEGKMFKLGWLECEAAHGIKE